MYTDINHINYSETTKCRVIVINLRITSEFHRAVNTRNATFNAKWFPMEGTQLTVCSG